MEIVTGRGTAAFTWVMWLSLQSAVVMQWIVVSYLQSGDAGRCDAGMRAAPIFRVLRGTDFPWYS